jgi:hypothetical protein
LLCGCGDVPTALFLRISISHKWITSCVQF